VAIFAHGATPTLDYAINDNTLISGSGGAGALGGSGGSTAGSDGLTGLTGAAGSVNW
jgi:hypothetical protein